MPTVPLWLMALVYPVGMFVPMIGLFRARHADPQPVMRTQARWTCYFAPAFLYLCFWNATATVGWLGAGIFLPFLLLGTYLCSLMLRMDEVLYGPR
jgi:hypothetical protein